MPVVPEPVVAEPVAPVPPEPVMAEPVVAEPVAPAPDVPAPTAPVVPAVPAPVVPAVPAPVVPVSTSAPAPVGTYPAAPASVTPAQDATAGAYAPVTSVPSGNYGQAPGYPAAASAKKSKKPLAFIIIGAVLLLAIAAVIVIVLLVLPKQAPAETTTDTKTEGTEQTTDKPVVPTPPVEVPPTPSGTGGTTSSVLDTDFDIGLLTLRINKDWEVQDNSVGSDLSYAIYPDRNSSKHGILLMNTALPTGGYQYSDDEYAEFFEAYLVGIDPTEVLSKGLSKNPSLAGRHAYDADVIMDFDSPARCRVTMIMDNDMLTTVMYIVYDDTYESSKKSIDEFMAAISPLD
jgi:hypothetical protein